MKILLLSILAISGFVLSVKAQHFEWVRQIGGPLTEYSESMTIDDNGHIFLTGRFRGTTDFDPGPGVFNLTAVGGLFNGFISKLDTAGNFIWAIGMTGNEVYWPSIAVDDDGNVYSSGFFYDTIDFDPGPGVHNLASASANADIYVGKWDSLGNLIWVKQLSGPFHNRTFDIALDANENIYIAGDFDSSIDADPGPGVYTLTGGNTYNILFFKLDTDGNFVWAKTLKGTNQSFAHRIAFDPTGYIYVTGDYIGTVDFDPDPDSLLISSNGARPSYVLKLDTLGNLVWVSVFESSFLTRINSIVLNDIGDVYVTGEFGGTVDFDPGPGIFELSSSSSQDDDIFICKLNSSGDLTWVKHLGEAPGDDVGTSIDTDTLGNIYISGYFQGTVDFNPGPDTFNFTAPANDYDPFLIKLDPAGNFVWAVIANGSEIAVDALDNIYLFGGFAGTYDFDPGPGVFNLTANSTSGDISLLKLYQDDCALTMFIDSIKSITCTEPGYIALHSNYGQPPYSYSWNIAPSINDSTTVIIQPGIYSISVMDFYGCKRKVSYLITAPKSPTLFDMNANVIAGPFIPGFPSTLRLYAFNDGCVPVSGTLQLVQSPLMDYVGATAPPDYINGDTLNWNYINLTSDNSPIKHIISFNISVTATVEDMICFQVILTSLVGDAYPRNNKKKYCFPVVNSHDPNDKQVYPQEGCNGNEVLLSESITYTISFQNTGNAPAINLFILDTLPFTLDINSVRVIGNSHKLNTEVLDTNILKFRFDNIMLPDSVSNEPESHGYVVFEVLPIVGLADKTVVENRSGIYFDFNEPVITNTVLSTLVNDYSEVDNSIDVSNSSELLANALGAMYQWIFCDSIAIAGATNRSFTPMVNGNYAVIVDQNGCTATSSCYTVTNVGLANNDLSKRIRIFPNPTDGNFALHLGDSYNNVSVFVKDIYGHIVLAKQFDFISYNSFQLNESPGLYLIELILDDGKTFHYKVLKQ